MSREWDCAQHKWNIVYLIICNCYIFIVHELLIIRNVDPKNVDLDSQYNSHVGKQLLLDWHLRIHNNHLQQPRTHGSITSNTLS